MDSILAALLNAPQQAGASAQPQAPSSADPGSAAQFKAQFDQAVAALANAAAPNAQSSTPVQTNAAGDALTADLQKKIADLLAQGMSVSDIVQQLAAALASTLAQQFGIDPATIQNQLQTVVASALSPPTTGPPLSNADLASALAQQFRQIADVAAGVLGETGQSNRLFAGSISDAATTAGVQPAPPTSDNNPAPADSMATDASALLASLTASQGDGKTVATNGVTALGPNGDTLLGRILARAAQSQFATSGSQTSNAAATQTGTSALTVMALAAANAALGNGAGTTTLPPISAAGTPLAAAVTSVISDATSTSTSASAASVEAAPAPLNPAVLAFVKAFTDALATTSTPATAKTTADSGTTSGTLLPTTDLSSQAPTIGAFAPVAAAVQNDPVATNGSHTSPTPPSTTTVDPNLVVDQILNGLSLTTVDTTSTVRMRLVPAELGDVSVKLTIEGSSVSAQVMAQTPAAHDALVAGQGQLTRAFEDAGLKLTSFNVDLAGGFTSFQQQQQQSSQQGPSYGQTLLGGVDTPEMDDSSLVAAPNFGPPVLAGVSWSALNYLV